MGDFPLLVGLDVMRANGMILNFDADEVTDDSATWIVPIDYLRGHAFITDATNSVLYTKPELEKLHLQFYHPSPGKLYDLLKRYNPDTIGPSVKSVLEEINAAFQTCSQYSTSPFWFRAAMPHDEIIFYHELAIDLVWLNGSPALHLVDNHTIYQNAEFITTNLKDAGALWETFLRCWVTVFIGYPSTMRLDQESSFHSVEFRKLSRDAGIELKFSGIESQNSIGVGEKYHDPLRRVYLKVNDEHPTLDRETVLRLALKGCNDTLASNGLVPRYWFLAPCLLYPRPTLNIRSSVNEC